MLWNAYVNYDVRKFKSLPTRVSEYERQRNFPILCSGILKLLI